MDSTIPEGAVEAVESTIMVDAGSIDVACWFLVSPEVLRVRAPERGLPWFMPCRPGACLPFPAYESPAIPDQGLAARAHGAILPAASEPIPRGCFQRWPARRPQLYRFDNSRAERKPAFQGAGAAVSMHGAGVQMNTSGKSPAKAHAKAHAKTWTLLTMLVLGLWGSLIVLTGGGIKSHYQAGSKAQPGAPGVPAR